MKDYCLKNGWSKILPIECEGGLDVDYEWQIPQVKFLLNKNGKKKVNKFVKFDSFEHFKNFNSSEKEKLLKKIESKSQNLKNLNKYTNYEKK